MQIQNQNAIANPSVETVVTRVPDFEVTGTGEAAAWNAAPWLEMPRVGGSAAYRTRAKLLGSDTGLYFLVECEDGKLACTMTRDFDFIFKEDVVEIFLQPDTAHPVYFEYEISPLAVELPLLVSHDGRRFHGWLPFAYEGQRRTRRATFVRGGRKESMAACERWSAEFFIPYALLAGLGNTPPAPGACWRGNLYRIDYDSGSPSQWAWCPDTGGNFHDFLNFGRLRFA